MSDEQLNHHHPFAEITAIDEIDVALFLPQNILDERSFLHPNDEMNNFVVHTLHGKHFITRIHINCQIIVLLKRHLLCTSEYSWNHSIGMPT